MSQMWTCCTYKKGVLWVRVACWLPCFLQRPCASAVSVTCCAIVRSPDFCYSNLAADPTCSSAGFSSGLCFSSGSCTHLPGISNEYNTGDMNRSMGCSKHVCLQVHVKAMEKGHPLAASRAAWSSPRSPYTPGPALQPPSASQQAYPMMQPGMPVMQNLAMGMQAGVPGMAWGGYGSLNAAKGYSPRGYSGLDGVGQALSAALQVNL